MLDQVADNPRYQFWMNDLAMPGQQDRMAVIGDIDGWYRIGTKNKSKHMYPVVIWHDGANEDAWVQVGGAVPFPLNSPKGLEFQASTWLSCEAVEDKHYQQALEAGVWWDGRAARKPPAQQRAEERGPAPADPAGPLSNSEKAEDLEVWQDQYDALKDAVSNLPEVLKSETQAKRADELYQRLRTLWKSVDALRVTEKKPYDEGAARVQAKYKPLLDAASGTGTTAKHLLDNWLREQERLQAEEERRLRAQQEEAHAKLGIPVDKPVTLPKPKVASGYGTKATSLRTTYVGVIDDEAKFIRSIKDRADFKEFLQSTANALARAKQEVKGMHIEERR